MSPRFCLILLGLTPWFILAQDSAIARQWAQSDVLFANKPGLGITGKQAIEFPIGSGKDALQSLDFWVTGIGPNQDTIAISADAFSSKSAWVAGPAANSGTKEHPLFTEWNHFIEVSAADIAYHKLNYKNNNYTPPVGIKHWPAAYNMPFFPTVLAGFADADQNKVYNWNKGDYPFVPGDQNIFTMAADSLKGLFGSGKTYKIDQSVLWFKPEDKDSVSNSMFFRITLCNRGDSAIRNVKISAASVFSIGNPDDNFLMTDVSASSLIAYNTQGLDAQYGSQWPAVAVGWLSRAATSTIYFENTADQVRGRPSTPQEYYHLSNGFWKTGKFLSFGSSGLDGNNPAKFVYSNGTDPNQANKDWDEPQGTAGRRNGLISTGGWTLLGGSCVVADGFVSVLANAPDSAKIRQSVQKIQQFYQNKDWALSSHLPTALHNRKAYPNPIRVGAYLQGPQGQALAVYSMTGQWVKTIPANDLGWKIDLSPGQYYLREMGLDNSPNGYKIVVE